MVGFDSGSTTLPHAPATVHRAYDLTYSATSALNASFV